MRTSSNTIMSTGLYRAAALLTDLLYLNLLWLLASVPIVTAPPATAALFGVVRKWQRHESPQIGRTFARLFKENFAQAMTVGWLLIAIGGFLATDLVAVRQMEGPQARILEAAAILMSTLYVLGWLYVFPVMVTFRATSMQVLRNSLLFAVARPSITLCGLAVFAATVTATVVIPPLVLIMGSGGAYCLYRLSAKTFGSVLKVRQEPLAEPPRSYG